MQVLIVGKGGREHALAWACARDSAVTQTWVAPGNPGTAAEPGVTNLNLKVGPELVDFAARQGIDLVLIGPEQPIVEGLGDAFRARGLNCLAPSAEAAQLEGSKAFAKQFMRDRGIPTADYGIFEDADQALQWVQQRGIPVAIKADGLAAGKGVVLAQDLAEAEAAIRWLKTEDSLAGAGRTLVVEELLSGREASFIALCDGHRALPLATSEDHKARDDGDRGPNTGGMGAVSPSPIIDAALERQILDTVVQPVVDGMAEAGTPFVGFLYAGLMISPQGQPKVLEFNCRLGDPEAQVLLYRHTDGFIRLCARAAAGELTDRDSATWTDRPAICVVGAAEGYPASPRTGDIISGLDTLGTDIKVFHSGTALDGEGQLVTAGGRILGLTALGDDVHQARQKAYASLDMIDWDGAFWRTDIGNRT